MKTRSTVLSALLIGAILAASLPVRAQTTAAETPNLLPTDEAIVPITVTEPATEPTIQGGIQTIVDAFKSGQTNWYVAAYGLYASGLGHKYGFGLAGFYPLSKYVVTGVRLDNVNGKFWMPSGNATLQVPLKLTSWLTVTPFTYAGIGIPVSGAKIGDVTIPGNVRDNNGQPTAILGYGAAVKIYQPSNKKWNIDLVADRETWSGFPGQQYRAGLLFHHSL